MCGIAGAFGEDARSWTSLVEEIVEDQVPRGPDVQATVTVSGQQSQAVLGHDRLSIIDLSPLANQPMRDGDGRWHIVYNGEIYNYVELREELLQLGEHFLTQSDTEVLLAAMRSWGEAALERLNGMFAFALYDAIKDEVWLVRDRFGVKPLFYAEHAGTLFFASTGKVLARRLGLAPNLEYVARGLKYWVFDDDSERSQYVGLKALRPGHCLRVRRASGHGLSMQCRRYYDLEDRVSTQRDSYAGWSDRALGERLDETLGRAVELRLRADVRLGVSVSGGLDSSTIMALLAEQHPEVVPFSYGHPSAPRSEGPLVDELALRYGLNVHYCWSEDAAQLGGAFWETLAAQDAPFRSGSMVGQYAVFKLARAEGVKVMLGGQGGDETLMGYYKFQLFRLRELLHQKRLGQAARFAVGLVPTILASAAVLPTLWAQRRRYSTASGLGMTLRLPEPPPMSLGYDPTQPVWHRQMLDIVRYSLPTLLRYEDRNSMGNSVETRLPFMDFHMVELGLALPERVKVRGGVGKWLLRRTMGPHLPRSIIRARYKRGFDVNQMDWLRGGLGAAIRTELIMYASHIREWLPRDGTIANLFSDDRLVGTQSAFPEAIALLWLGSRA